MGALFARLHNPALGELLTNIIILPLARASVLGTIARVCSRPRRGRRRFTRGGAARTSGPCAPRSGCSASSGRRTAPTPDAHVRSGHRSTSDDRHVSQSRSPPSRRRMRPHIPHSAMSRGFSGSSEYQGRPHEALDRDILPCLRPAPSPHHPGRAAPSPGLSESRPRALLRVGAREAVAALAVCFG